ncbi:MAG TPA: DUF2182 domain-containing protein [Acidimicrobiales bacterium]|nr:DUF2182 domain-containing protein [Acidimicrobiales bacterium]
MTTIAASGAGEGGRGALAPTWAVLAALGAVAWAVTVPMARSMGVGPGTMGTAFLVFLGGWVAMMAAMMLPGVGPAAARDLPAGTAVTAAWRMAGAVPFALGFLGPWTVYGVAFFAALAATGRLVDHAPDAAAALGVAILAVAGAYQLSPLKQQALTRCRSTALGRPGALARVVSGAHEGARCVGCCWALMAVLIAFGSMNLAAMAALAVVVFAEKVRSRPRPVSWAAGAVLLALAVAAALDHSLLSGLTPMPM